MAITNTWPTKPS